MIEATIVCPVVFGLLLAIVHASESRRLAHATAARARRCAMSLAREGCPGEARPRCPIEHGRGAGSESAELRAAARLDGVLGGIDLFSLPLLGDALDQLFGGSVTATSTSSYRSVRRSIGALQIERSTTLLCNPTLGSEPDVATQTFRDRLDRVQQ